MLHQNENSFVVSDKEKRERRGEIPLRDSIATNALLRNDVSYLYCQVFPDCFTINNNFVDRLRQLTQLSFVSLLSGLT